MEHFLSLLLLPVHMLQNVDILRFMWKGPWSLTSSPISGPAFHTSQSGLGAWALFVSWDTLNCFAVSKPAFTGFVWDRLHYTSMNLEFSKALDPS